MFEFRTDVATLQPAKRMSDGRLVSEALITKPGVFAYADAAYPNGTRLEYRPDEEVYSKETMDSFANLPITPTHPPMLLTANNAKSYMVGSTGDKVSRAPVVGDSDWLKTGVMVADAKTLAKMDSGDNAVSCGYACRIDETPGVHPKYGPYHVIQRDIRGNHLAVALPAGRAGRLARVRMDAELTSEERGQLAAGKFAYPEANKLPIENKDHVVAAMARFSATDFSAHPGASSSAVKRIAAAAKKFGLDPTNFVKKYGGRSDDYGDGVVSGEYAGGDSSGATELVVMTTAVDGHQHTMDPTDSSGCTSYAYSDGADQPHKHEYVRAADGSVTIGENAGHKHEVDNSTLGMRGDAAATNVSGGGARGGRFDSSNRGDNNMNELEQLRASVAALEEGLKASEKEAAALKVRADAAEIAAGEAKGALKTLEQERDALKITIAAGATAVQTDALVRERTRADEAEAKVSRFDEAIDSRVEERSDLQFKAASVLGADFKMRGLTDRQIIATVVKRLDASADVGDGVEDAYLKGRFDSLLRLNLDRARQNANVSSILSGITNEAQNRADSSREKRAEEFRNQAKRPLSELIGKKGA